MYTMFHKSCHMNWKIKFVEMQWPIFNVRWQMKGLTILEILSGGNTPILRQNGAIAIFMAPPRKSECVPDCYKKLHFRPLLISMHFWLTSLIDYYTRNAFSFSGLAHILRHCANVVAPIRKILWQKIVLAKALIWGAAKYNCSNHVL